MEWWYFGPVILAVVMFLLVGTIFERRIEVAMRSFMERRRTLLLQQAQLDQQQLQTATMYDELTDCTDESTVTSDKQSPPQSCADVKTGPGWDPPTKYVKVTSGTSCMELPSGICYTEVPPTPAPTPCRTVSRKSIHSVKSSCYRSAQNFEVNYNS